MSKRPEFEFTSAAACRDKKVNNCVEVAVNVPGVVAVRESDQPGVIMTTTPERWALFVQAVREGEFDLSA